VCKKGVPYRKEKRKEWMKEWDGKINSEKIQKF